MVKAQTKKAKTLLKTVLASDCARATFFVMLIAEKDAVYGRKADKMWKLIDELVEAVKILHPRMYTTFIDKVQDL